MGPLNELSTERQKSEEEEHARQHFGLRLSAAAIVIISLFAVLVIRLWSLQIIQGSARNAAAQALTNAQVQTPAPRGIIFSRDGTIFAGDQAETVVTLNLPYADRIAPDEPTLAMEQRLASLIPGLTAAAIKNDMKSQAYYAYQPIPIAGIPPSEPKVSAQTVALLAQHAAQFPAVSVDTNYYTRTYPQGSVAAQTIGYVHTISAAQYLANKKFGYSQNDPQFGQTGVEGQYERQLAGKPGIQQVEVDPQSNVIQTKQVSQPTAGDDVVLNMDAGLERTLQSYLTTEVQRLGSPWGGAVVLDPQTGAVLAMASSPTYDNNIWVPGISSANYASLTNGYNFPLNNYAVDRPQPPGSTFKIATATAALDSGLISPYTPIDDTGSYTLGNQTLYDSESRRLGPINVTTALSASSDVFFYTLGGWFYEQSHQYGKTPIENMAQRYGLGNADGTLESSGIDLANAGATQVDGPSLRTILHSLSPTVYPNTYYEGDAVQTAFGQGYTLETPLSLANAYATFANGGTRHAPEMAAAIVSPTGKVVQTIAPKVLSKVTYGPGVYSAMLAGFQGAVQASDGTAYGDFQGFDFTNWNVAGKTGTATYASGAPTGWFVGFGGPKNQPTRYVVAVEIYHGGYGANSSAIVVRQIFNYLHQHPVGAVVLPKP